MMRRLNLLLVAAGQLCAARQPGFSIHQDLLAYPQFEVVFSETFVSEPEAKALLESAAASTHPSYEADFNDKDISSRIQSAAAEDAEDAIKQDSRSAKKTYEVMSTHANRYLCEIPVIKTPPPPNKTATELAKADEARELARASAHGWELVNGLDGSCLYFVSGWWSYSFCYGHDVQQFHALPGRQAGALVKDPRSQEYVLGRVQSPQSPANSHRGHGAKAAQRPERGEDSAASPPANMELQVKGDQRYLVQRLEEGTLCDLTQRPRNIEVQYHCSPGSTQDRIGWIKEITTCSYLMVVNTPRLCTDVAFRPPQEQPANVISCRTIVSESEQADWHARKTLEAQAAMSGEQQKQAQAPVVIGGVIVGGRQILGRGEDGKAPNQLTTPRGFANGGEGTVVELVAVAGDQAEGTTLDMLSDEELEKLDLDPEFVDELQKKMQELAGDKGWRLEIVETPDGPRARDVRGVVVDGDLREGQHEKGDQASSEGHDDNGEGGDEKGSEEKFFKEEL